MLQVTASPTLARQPPSYPMVQPEAQHISWPHLPPGAMSVPCHPYPGINDVVIDPELIFPQHSEQGRDNLAGSEKFQVGLQGLGRKHSAHSWVQPVLSCLGPGFAAKLRKALQRAASPLPALSDGHKQCCGTGVGGKAQSGHVMQHDKAGNGLRVPSLSCLPASYCQSKGAQSLPFCTTTGAVLG